MYAQRQKPIDFATEGFRLALPAERNYGIRVESELFPLIKAAAENIRPMSASRVPV
jgi:hypothetical protein